MGRTGLRPTDTPDPYELYYLGGFFDGEGCVRWDGSTPRAEVRTCRPQQLNLLQHHFGGTIRSVRNDLSISHKPQFHWSISGADCARFLALIQPFTLEKRDQIALLRAIDDQYRRTDWFTESAVAVMDRHLRALKTHPQTLRPTYPIEPCLEDPRVH